MILVTEVFTVSPAARHPHHRLRPKAHPLPANVSCIVQALCKLLLTLDHSSDVSGTNWAPKPFIGSAATRCPFAFQFGNSRCSPAAYLGKASRSLHIRPLPEQGGTGASRRKIEGGSNLESPERQLHSLLLSGLLDTKLFQSLEYPLGKQFMCKTIGMWIGRRHPQLR